MQLKIPCVWGKLGIHRSINKQLLYVVSLEAEHACVNPDISKAELVWNFLSNPRGGVDIKCSN